MARELKGEKLEKELLRLEEMKAYEKENAQYELICGIDEAGRGPLAGPVAAGAVILPKDCQILYLNDSKKLSEKRREELFLEIKEKALAWSVGIATPQRIDEINILQATPTFRGKFFRCLSFVETERKAYAQFHSHFLFIPSMVLAKIRAQVVLPTPRGPQNR